MTDPASGRTTNRHVLHDPREREGFTAGGDGPTHQLQADQGPRLPGLVERREEFPESNVQEEHRASQPRRASLDSFGPCRGIVRDRSEPSRTRRRTILTPPPMVLTTISGNGSRSVHTAMRLRRGSAGFRNI